MKFGFASETNTYFAMWSLEADSTLMWSAGFWILTSCWLMFKSFRPESALVTASFKTNFSISHRNKLSDAEKIKEVIALSVWKPLRNLLNFHQSILTNFDFAHSKGLETALRDRTLSSRRWGRRVFVGIMKNLRHILMGHEIFFKIFDGSQNIFSCSIFVILFFKLRGLQHKMS